MENSPVKIQVNFQLQGEDAERFLAYKRRERISATSEAGRKLALERLDQIEKEAAA